MMKSQSAGEFDYPDEESSKKAELNVGVIAFTVASVVLCLVVIFFIKTYASQKKDLINVIKSENDILEVALKETFNKNHYIMRSISQSIKRGDALLPYVKKKLELYDHNNKIHKLFPWNELIWIDDSLTPVASSKKISYKKQTHIDRDSLLKSKNNPGKVMYWSSVSKESSHQPIIYALMSLKSDDGAFMGVIAVSYDAASLNKYLSYYKRKDTTNFMILDLQYNKIMQSKPRGKRSKPIDEQINFEMMMPVDASGSEDMSTSYIDMMNGRNYYVKQVAGEPFILLTSFDMNEARNIIFNSVVMKFLEISIFASMFLLLIVVIYNREVMRKTILSKAYRDIKHAMEVKSDFLTFTAHEIRSPLGFIMTGSEVMCKKMLGPISGKYLEYLEGINKSAQRILEFINDILDEEHIIAGNFKMVASYNVLQEIIDEAVGQNKSRYLHKKVDINVSLPKVLPRMYCDAGRILQVFNNLISNSIKYSKDEARIDISAKIVRGELLVKIEDHGIGMSQDDIKVALTKFGTAHKASLDLRDSYGLGLAIVKLLLDAHDAIFSVESKVDVGTIVTIIFPEDRLEKAKKEKGSNEKQ